jgi:hypothetical protein
MPTDRAKLVLAQSVVALPTYPNARLPVQSRPEKPMSAQSARFSRVLLVD